MALSKAREAVTLTAFDKIIQQFSVARAHSRPCLNVTPANILEIN